MVGTGVVFRFIVVFVFDRDGQHRLGLEQFDHDRKMMAGEPRNHLMMMMAKAPS